MTTSIFVISVVTGIYTVLGGLKAVFHWFSAEFRIQPPGCEIRSVWGSL
ncbi:MAG: hypothetical protein L0387_10930 [Acidobacteria bacterium]|nr:hypothetical protein [Acidobacteriota bacterium]